MIAAIFGLVFIATGLGSVAWRNGWSDHTSDWLILAGGFAALVGSDDFAAFTGNHGWTRDQWYEQPAWYVKIVGAGIIFFGGGSLLQWW